MKPLRWYRRRLVAIAATILLLPILLWGAILVVTPTGWARARLVRELEAATGRKVAIDEIRLGLLGNFRARGIAVAEPGTPSDPWLRAEDARLDVHLLGMLTGCCRPTDIAVDGLDLRVHRRADGTLEFADLLAADPDAPSPTPADEAAASKRGVVTLTLTRAKVALIDDPSATRLDFDSAVGKATWDGTHAVVEGLKGRLNGGTMEFACKYDRNPGAPAFEAETVARGVSLGVGMRALGLLVPVVSDASDSLAGTLDLDLTLKGAGTSLADLTTGLKGHGAIRLEPIDLSASKLLDTIDALKKIPRSSRVGAVSSHFAIEGGRVSSDDLTLRVARLPITLAGWTDFAGRIDYRLKSDVLRDKLAGKMPDEARRILGEVREELGDLAQLRITGTIDAPRLSTPSLGREPGRPLGEAEKARLQNAAGRVLDRYLR